MSIPASRRGSEALLKVARLAAHTAHPRWYRAVLVWAMLVLLHLPGFPRLTDDLPPAAWAAVAGDVVLFGAVLFAATALRRAPRATALVLLLLGLHGVAVLVWVCVALLGGRHTGTPFFAVTVAANASLAAALVVALVLAWPFRTRVHVGFSRSVPRTTPDRDADHRGSWLRDLPRSRALWYAALYAVLVGTGRYWSTAIPLGDSLFSLLILGGFTVAPAAFGYWIVREARAPTVAYAFVAPSALVVLALSITALVPSLGRRGMDTRQALEALIWMTQLVGLKLWCLAVAGGAFGYADRQSVTCMAAMIGQPRES